MHMIDRTARSSGVLSIASSSHEFCAHGFNQLQMSNIQKELSLDRTCTEFFFLVINTHLYGTSVVLALNNLEIILMGGQIYICIIYVTCIFATEHRLEHPQILISVVCPAASPPTDTEGKLSLCLEYVNGIQEISECKRPSGVQQGLYFGMGSFSQVFSFSTNMPAIYNKNFRFIFDFQRRICLNL